MAKHFRFTVNFSVEINLFEQLLIQVSSHRLASLVSSNVKRKLVALLVYPFRLIKFMLV